MRQLRFIRINDMTLSILNDEQTKIPNVFFSEWSPRLTPTTDTQQGYTAPLTLIDGEYINKVRRIETFGHVAGELAALLKKPQPPSDVPPVITGILAGMATEPSAMGTGQHGPCAPSCGRSASASTAAVPSAVQSVITGTLTGIATEPSAKGTDQHGPCAPCCGRSASEQTLSSTTVRLPQSDFKDHTAQ